MVLPDARIFHVNVNCASLERSLPFYCDGLGLAAATRTTPATTQPGDAFGLATARWDAWILTGVNGFDGGAVDLLEWHEPRPVGAPPATMAEAGFQRLGVIVDDLDATIDRVRAGGGRMWSEPFTTEAAGPAGVRLVFASDPDGSPVELIETAGGPRLSFVAVTCTDLDASVAWYGALGMREIGRFVSHSDDASHLGIDGPAAFVEVMLAPAGGGEVLLGLVGFTTPTPTPPPSRPANALGPWRMAMLVGDLDGACAAMRALGIDSFLSAPVAMAMGPGLPELRFVCLRGPDGEVVELIETPT